MSVECNLVVLALDQIRLDGGTQIREAVDEEVVNDYAALMANQVYLPPLCVFYDGQDYWLVDGFHRWHALKKNGRTETLCQPYDGSLREARLAAVRSNHAHGLRRTNADKRRAVETLLADAEWANNSSRWIAEAAGVGPHMVIEMREQLCAAHSCQQGGEGVRVGLDGRKRRVRPSGAEDPLRVNDDAVDRVDVALQAAPVLDVCIARLKDASRLGEKLARGPGGGYFDLQLALYQDYLKRTLELLADTRPRVRCGQCAGAGCEACFEFGYLCAASEGDGVVTKNCD